MSADDMDELWGDDLRLTTTSPTLILNVQAGRLKKKTGGVLYGEVSGTESIVSIALDLLTGGVQEDGTERVVADAVISELYFDIRVPALDAYRERLMIVRHHRERVYPAAVTAWPIVSYKDRLLASERADRESQLMHLNVPGAQRSLSVMTRSQAEFEDVISFVFKTPATRSILESLIAKSNEAKTLKERAIAQGFQTLTEKIIRSMTPIVQP